MNKFHIYSDSSYDNKTNIAVCGAYVIPSDQLQDSYQPTASALVVSELADTSGSKAEVEAILLGLSKLEHGASVTIYTDAKSASELPGRRERLEQSGFVSKRSGNLLSNAEVYKSFFAEIDHYNIELRWIKGHSPSAEKDLDARLFSFVDKAVRSKLREIRASADA